MRASGFSHIVILTLLLLISSIVFSQVTTGTPPFRSFSGGPDVINLGNFNVHYSIPIFSRPGRGTPFTYALSYDSSVWTIVSSTWAPVSSTWGLNRELGARVGTVTVKSIPIRGCDGAGATGYTFSKYVDSAGTTHKFFAAVNDDPDCVGTWTATRVLDDGSGITITVDATPSATVTLKNGDVIKPILSSGTNSGSGTSTDYNGNKITSTVVGTTTTFYDTLSTSVPALIIDASNPNSVKYKYAAPGDTNPSSPGVKVTAGYVNKNVKTAFGCSGIGEYGGASGIPTALLDTITLADGSFYKFAYEPTTKDATTVTGRIASVTLPTGGQITYTYTGGSHGIMCADGSTAGFDRTTPDTGSAHWSFLRASSPTTTTKVTDPTGNDTVATFNGEFETARDVYQGPSSGSVLEHITTCYNGTSASPCGGTVTTPFSQVTVERQFNGGSQSRVDTMYDGYGSVTELDEFDFGTSSPTRQTTTVYASLGNNIVDRPASVTVKDGSGTQKAKTAYGYDEYTLQGTGTLPNHGSVTGARGNLTTIKQYSSATAFLTRTLKYYDTGLMYTSADVNPTAVTTYTYGYCAGAFPSSISLPLGLSRSMIWNCNGSVVTSSTDENSKATTYTYDDPYFWRPHTIGRPDGGQTTFTYHTGSFPLVGTWSIDSSSKIDAAANYLTETTNFDTLGRVAHANLTSAPEGTITTDIAFDSSGRVASRSNAHLSTPSPTDGTTSYEYDALNRVTTVTRPNGSTVQTSYNIGAAEIQDEGNGTSSIAKILQSDGLGRLKSVCEVTSAPQLGISANPAPCNQDISATGFLTSYNYDTLDNITQVTQGGLNPRQYAYDQMSRLTSSTTPEAGITTYTYDHTGQLGDLYTRLKPKANQTNASVKTTTTYTHDLLHRLTAVTYDDGSSNATYGYDESSVSSVTVTNGKGRLTHMSGRDSTEVYSYDAVGRRNGGTQCAPISCGGTWWPLTYTYNYLGGVTSFTNGYESRTYSYTYDNAGRLTKMTSSLNDSTHPGTLLTVNTYNPLGEITKETLGNGIVRTLGYDNGGRVTSVTDGSLYSFTLGYAPNGDVLTGNDSTNGNWTYTYDSFNRIATSAKTGNAFAYQYDRFGNRWQQNVTAGTGPAPSYVLDANNHITTFTYDAAGNVLNDTFHNYTYDAEGRQLTMDTSAATYQYDPLGRRIRRTVGSAIYNHILDPQGHIITVAGPSANSSELYAGNMHVATYANSNTYFHHSDWLGTVRVRTNASGASVETCTSLAYGDALTCSGADWSPLHFTGADWDSESSASNLNRFLFRQYSATQGRWMTPDPGGLAVSIPINPQTWNRYAYVLGNPAILVDPTGPDPCFKNDPKCPPAPPGSGDQAGSSGSAASAGSYLRQTIDTTLLGSKRSFCDGPCWRKLARKLSNIYYEAIHTTACLAASPLIGAAKLTDGTVGTGFAGSFAFGILVTGVSGSASASLVADPHFNVGFAFAASGNPGGPGVAGAGFSGGRQVTLSEAQHVSDLNSTSPVVNGSAGPVSGSYSTNPTTVSIAVGAGRGGQVGSVEYGGTYVPQSTTIDCSDVL